MHTERNAGDPFFLHRLLADRTPGAREFPPVLMLMAGTRCPPSFLPYMDRYRDIYKHAPAEKHCVPEKILVRTGEVEGRGGLIWLKRAETLA